MTTFTHIFLPAIFLLGCCSGWQLSSTKDSSTECAQLHLQPAFKGQYLKVKDNEQFSDLTNVFYHLQQSNGGPDNDDDDEQPANNVTNSLSFLVREHCTLTLSESTSLGGEVHEFHGDVDNMDWLQPKSAACECPKVCTCEDHKLRRSECARAYLRDDCTNCNSIFTSMRADDKSRKSFPQKWTGDVRAIILKDGCDLHLDSAENPNPQVLRSSSSRVFMDVEKLGNITQYRCQCSERSTQTNENVSVKERNPNYPPWVNIPKTKGAINSLLSREGMRKHPGLVASLQSLRKKRTSKNAYILLLGLTGSGKSSAVNLLFDHPNITKVGDYVSTTSDILEFTIPVPVDELGLNNSQLHVIDTPGIGDTRGIAQDATFLASLDDYLNKHQDLKRSLPNVVLIFSKFSDNRFRGEGSSFVKMLRTIDLFKDRIIDRKSTNVVFVLTHVMSETNEITRNPTERINSIRQVIQEFCTLPRPIHIVLAENKPEEAQLPSVNGYYRLPNKEFYPKNLFDQMQRNLVDNGDPIGEAIIRTAFSDSDNFQISGKRHRLLHPSNAKVTKYLGILGSFNKPVSDTEVSLELSKAFPGMSQEMKTRYPNALNTLQRTLYMRNIIQFSDIPQTSSELIRLWQELEINPATVFLLKSLNVTIPDFQGSLVVGSGYSLVKDETLPTSIFRLEKDMESMPNQLLLRMPHALEESLTNQLDPNFQVFREREEYIKSRLFSLGVSPDVLPMSSYAGAPLKYPGFNLVSLNDESENDEISTWNSLTASVDYHTFQLRLTKNAHFSDEFDRELGGLNRLNLSDFENVENWRHFFDRYGTHVVTQGYGGGSIQVTVETDPDAEVTFDNTEKFRVLSEAMSEIVQQLANELIGKVSAYTPSPGVKYGFVQRGGSHKHFWTNFSDVDDVKNVESWRESLEYEPVMLTSRLQLVPISEVVKEYYSQDDANADELGYMIEEAGASLMDASLVYIPVQRVGRESDNPEDRDGTSGFGGAVGDFQSMQEFAAMLKMMSDSSHAMQAELVKALGESQQRQLVQEAQYQQEVERRRQEEAERDRIYREDQRYDREMEMKREYMEMERQEREEKARLEREDRRREMMAQERVAMEQTKAQQEQFFFQFLNMENQRRHEAMVNQKGWLDKTFDFVGSIFSSAKDGASAVAPALMMAGG